MAATVSDLRQILKEDSSGKNLYDHLTETLMKILIDRPANAFDNFELISNEVKENPLNPDPIKSMPMPMSKDELSKKQAWTQKCATLFKVPAEPPEDTGVLYPPLVEDSTLMEWAGISFGKGDTYRLYLSIKALAESGKIPGDAGRLRFYGKFNTRSAPYFVLEGINPEEPEVDPIKQEGKSGANKYAYWVSQSADALPIDWIKLPNVTCAQIIAARQFKRFLTGKLDASVPSYPPFSGSEKELLRTQIALISASTLISPDGFFSLDESDPPVPIPAEGESAYQAKSAAELNNPDAWKHHEFGLNVLGRVTRLPEPEGDGEIVEVEGNDPMPALDSLKEGAWGFRVCPGGSGNANFSTVVARSLVYPGAVAIAAGTKFLNIYVGNGIAYDPKPYSPPLPQLVQNEFVASEDFPLVEPADVKVDPTPPVLEGEPTDD